MALSRSCRGNPNLQRVMNVSFPSPAVVVALVLGDQLVQLKVAGLLRYAAGDPLLDPRGSPSQGPHLSEPPC